MAEPLLLWVYTSDNPCPDCLYRAATQDPRGQPLSYWISRGVPGSGATVCRSKCQCQLLESDYVNASSDVDVRDRKIRFIKSGEIAPVPGVVENFYELLAQAQAKSLLVGTVEQQLFSAESVARQVEILQQLLGKAVSS